MLISYDFGDLEAFVAVMESGSFHLAAERSNLSQPAVTRRVRKLEAALGAQLFERTTRMVRPTLAGKRLYGRAQALLADARETTMAVRDENLRFAHQRNAVVTVAAVPTVIAGWLVPAIARIRMAGHGMRVQLRDHATNEVAEAVAAGDADFGISAMPMREPNLSFRPLFDEPLQAVLHFRHPFCEDHLTWAQLAEFPLILPAKGTGNRLLIDDAMASARLPLRWSFEARRSTTALELARAGLGLAILPKSVLTLAGGQGLRALPISGPEILRPMGVLTRTGSVLSKPAADLCEAVMDIAEGPVPPPSSLTVPEPSD